jgi:hypothetical protein
VTSGIPPKPNVHHNIYLEAVIREPALYNILIFYVPNSLSIFFALDRLPKESVKFRDTSQSFVKGLLFTVEKSLAPNPTPKPKVHPFSALRSYPP